MRNSLFFANWGRWESLFGRIKAFTGEFDLGNGGELTLQFSN